MQQRRWQRGLDRSYDSYEEDDPHEEDELSPRRNESNDHSFSDEDVVAVAVAPEWTEVRRRHEHDALLAHFLDLSSPRSEEETQQPKRSSDPPKPTATAPISFERSVATSSSAREWDSSWPRSPSSSSPSTSLTESKQRSARDQDCLDARASSRTRSSPGPTSPTVLRRDSLQDLQMSSPVPVYFMLPPELKKCLEEEEQKLMEALRAKADLQLQLASVEEQISTITKRTNLLSTLLDIRHHNKSLAEETTHIRSQKARLKQKVVRVRHDLDELKEDRKKAEEDLALIKQEKLELKQIAAKKREVDELAAELQSRKDEADALRCRLEEGERKLLEDREMLEHEKEQLAKEQVKMSNVQQFSRKIKLNVGGSYFLTSLSTLTQMPSMFSAMFSGKYSMEADEDGSYFIDRDPTHFRYILNFLRDSHVELPTEYPALLRELMTEAEFYQVEGLTTLLSQALEELSADRSMERGSFVQFGGESLMPSLTTAAPPRDFPLPHIRPAKRSTPSTIPSTTTRLHSRPMLKLPGHPTS